MKFEEHCNESITLFGNPYKEDHLWLDEFAGKPPYGMKHRKIRHHLQGIMEVEKRFGIEAGLAAKAHIISDLKMEGWKESDHFPVDERDYVRMGLF